MKTTPLTIGSPEAEKYFAAKNRRRERRGARWKALGRGVKKCGNGLIVTTGILVAVAAIIFILIGTGYALVGGGNEHDLEKQVSAQSAQLSDLAHRVDFISQVASNAQSASAENERNINRSLDLMHTLTTNVKTVLKNHKEFLEDLDERLEALNDQVNPPRTNALYWPTISNIVFTNIPVFVATNRIIPTRINHGTNF